MVIQYKVRDLLWRPAGQLVRFVAVIHPTRGSCLLMCTDTSLAAIEIIRLYGLRFKTEHTFKQAVRLIGSFNYHFWMSDMRAFEASRWVRNGVVGFSVPIHQCQDMTGCSGGWQACNAPARCALMPLEDEHPPASH